jgi:hypothetical protein
MAYKRALMSQKVSTAVAVVVVLVVVVVVVVVAIFFDLPCWCSTVGLSNLRLGRLLGISLRIYQGPVLVRSL